MTIDRDLIQVHKISTTSVDPATPVIGRQRAAAGLYGPIEFHPGRGRGGMVMYARKSELVKRGFHVELPTAAHKEIAAKIFTAIDAALTASTLGASEQIRIFHSFLPVLDMLIPTDTETEEGQPQTKDESTPPDGSIERR
jgi:hypothetical protein